MGKKCECALCGHTWEPRVESPKQCPGCKRYDWREVKDKCPTCGKPLTTVIPKDNVQK